MQTITEKTIDIEAVLRSKMGSKARWVPRFAVKWLKHIAHEDQVNEFLWQARDLTGTPWLVACLNFLGVKIEVEGMENLPSKDDERLYTFVSNHPLGGIDGVAIGSVLGRQYNDRFRYLVNDLLMNLPGLAPLCIPINKTGKQSRDFPRMVEAGFKSQNHILMFPAGLCSRRRHGEVCDLDWKKTFITKSVETQRDVVPIHFEGHNSKFFYRLSNISDRLVKKVNIAMLFLVDEMFKNTGNTFRIHIGKPISWQTFDKSRTPAEWAAFVKEQVYRLNA
ncbi:MAG: glycerol acyltransferase [Prevotella sp.]|nr:glycerol acyltransferase [Prevotella sp.]